MSNDIDYDKYEYGINKNIVVPRFKLQLLNPDESVYDEVIEDVVGNNGNESISMANGARRTMSLTLDNSKGRWNVNKNSDLWVKTKFFLWLGCNVEGEDIMFPSGIYISKDPQMISNGSNQTVQINGVDRYNFIDGTLGGELANDMEIPIHTNFVDAIKMIINLYDPNIKILISETYKDYLTSCTIKQSRGNKLSDLLKQVCDWVSANYYFDCNGVFRVENGVYDLDDSIKDSKYDFNTNELNYLGSTVTVKNSEIFNAVNVRGWTNTSSQTASAYIENTNLLSDFNIYKYPKRVKVVDDNVISTNDQAMDRAKWVLKQCAVMQKSISLSSAWLPHLNEVNTVVSVGDTNVGLIDDRFLIKNINIPIATSGKMTIEGNSTNELNFSV